MNGTWTLPMAGPYAVTGTLPFYSSSWSTTGERHDVSAVVGLTASTKSARVGYYPITTPVTVTVSDCCVYAIGRRY